MKLFLSNSSMTDINLILKYKLCKFDSKQKKNNGTKNKRLFFYIVPNNPKVAFIRNRIIA